MQIEAKNIMNSETGKYIIVAGLIIIAAGIIIYFFPNAFNRFGNLPGDVTVKKENFRFYFPAVTMIIVSVVVTLLINIIRKLL